MVVNYESTVAVMKYIIDNPGKNIFETVNGLKGSINLFELCGAVDVLTYYGLLTCFSKKDADRTSCDAYVPSTGAVLMGLETIAANLESMPRKK